MPSDLIVLIAIGFAAQMVDGAIGMAYGLTATSMMIGSGIPPAQASAAVHAAEIFTTAASGASHWRHGNIDRRLVVRLAVPGAIGAAIGAFALANVPGDRIRPYVSAYLLAMGAAVLWRAFWKNSLPHRLPRRVPLLGFTGGFLDAIGGGGWGAMVTTTLIGRGVPPRFAIGSANAAEFFVTTTATAIFVATIGLSLWPVITGLVIGGILAAPFAAYGARYIPPQLMMILVGVVVILLSLRSLAMTWR